MITRTSIAVLCVVLAFIGSSFYLGYEQGKGKVTLEFNTYKSRQEKLVSDATVARILAEQRLSTLSREYEQSLTEVRKENETAIALSAAANVVRLQQLETRERRYRFLSESTDAERRALADLATELDRTLTEGRYLVEELRREVALRNLQLVIIGEQIRAERTDRK